ncbi:MAG: YbaB/EbfC family nucleoid-associated protein [Chloroflexota bacterium]|nr:YbaB/EbfC family nucleoid-associated protein [Chloroflexota bacterium]
MMNKNMMRQAQQLQKQMANMQEEIENSKIENSVGGGVVKVVVTGKMIVESIEIDPEVVDAEDVEMLQDLVQTAINGAIEKAQELASTKMGALTGGLNIPGLT